MIRMDERIRQVETTEEKKMEMVKRIKNMEIWKGTEEGDREKGKRGERNRKMAGGADEQERGKKLEKGGGQEE